jgi:hypothetical protein
MRVSVIYLTILCAAILALGGYSSQAAAQIQFFDDFEDRAKDQAIVGNNWTWYDQTFEGDTCTGTPAGFGPYDDGDPSDYEVENRNYWTASEEYASQGDSYFRAGLEVPAWATDEGAPVVLSNMLRVYGNQYNEATSCERALVFQEMAIDSAGTYTFSFDVAQDRYGAPANGEHTAAFVKVLRSSDASFTTMLFEETETTPPVATLPDNVTTASQSIEFEITEEFVGELLQFGFYNDLTEDLGQSWTTSAALYDNVSLAPMEIGPAHSGSWYNSDQSGHGFSIEFGQQADGSTLAIVYWYIYDDLGNPIFMLGTGVPDGNQVEIVFESPVGMVYGVFDKDSVTREDGGTAVFVFDDRKNATFSYTPSAFTSSQWGHTTPIEALPLTRLFGIPADKYFNMSR